eukprot:TRINITY_DN9335_c0_g1_i1.p1 TRINITY_DN9335_c0_g1~~TRINITY_DN9335_c0_g1_i1.p1  ORF type:complete len:104 (+),score=5.12 TRINITY_DN9335_c0_g1_i1:65-376(+)
MESEKGYITSICKNDQNPDFIIDLGHICETHFFDKKKKSSQLFYGLPLPSCRVGSFLFPVRTRGIFYFALFCTIHGKEISRNGGVFCGKAAFYFLGWCTNIPI